MKTSTVSSTEVEEHAGAVDRRAPARHAAQLIGTLVLNVVLLVGGVRLTGFAWQDLCLLLLPPMLASVGAGVGFLILNRMALRSLVPAAADLSPHLERNSQCRSQINTDSSPRYWSAPLSFSAC